MGFKISKKIIIGVLSVLLTMFFMLSFVCVIGNNTIEASSDGMSIASTVVELETADQFKQYVFNNRSGGLSGVTIKLTKDLSIPLENSGFFQFDGIFDGQGHTLTFTGTTPTTKSFFGDIYPEGTIKNLKIINYRYKIPALGPLDSDSYVGTIADYNGGTIESCIVEGTIFTSDRYKTNCFAAGLVGSNYGDIKDCIVGDLYMAGVGSNVLSNPDGMYCSPFVARDSHGYVMGFTASNCVFNGTIGIHSSSADVCKNHLIAFEDMQGDNYKSLYNESIFSDKARGPIDKCDSNWYEYESGYHYLRVFITWTKYTIKSAKLDDNYGTVELTENNSNTDVETDDTGKIYYDYLPAKPVKGECVYLNSELKFCGDIYTAQDNTSGQYYFKQWSLSGTTYTATFEFNGETFIEFQNVNNATMGSTTKKHTVEAGVVITGERYSNTQYRFSWKYNNVTKYFSYTAKSNYTFPEDSDQSITTSNGKNIIVPPTPKPTDLTITFPKITNTNEDAETITIKYGSSISISCDEDCCKYSWDDGYGNSGEFEYTPVDYYTISNYKNLDGKSFNVTAGGNISSTYRPTLKAYSSYTLSFQSAGISGVSMGRINSTSNSVKVYKTSILSIYTEYEGEDFILCYTITNTSGQEVTIYYKMPSDGYEIVDAGGDSWGVWGDYEILSAYTIKPNIRLSDTCDIIFKQNDYVKKYSSSTSYPDITESDYKVQGIKQGKEITVTLKKTSVKFKIEGRTLTFNGSSYKNDLYKNDVDYYLECVTINGTTFYESGDYTIPENYCWYELDISLCFTEPISLVFYKNGYDQNEEKITDITASYTTNVDYNLYDDSLKSDKFLAHILLGTPVHYKQENNKLIYYWTDLDGDENKVTYDVSTKYQLCDADWYDGDWVYYYEEIIQPVFETAKYDVRLNVDSARNVRNESNKYGVTVVEIPGIKKTSAEIWTDVEYDSSISVKSTTVGGYITTITVTCNSESFKYEAESGYAFNGVYYQNKTNCTHTNTPSDYICLNCSYKGPFIGSIRVTGYTIIEVSVLKIGDVILQSVDNAKLYDSSGNETTSISKKVAFNNTLTYWDSKTNSYINRWQVNYSYEISEGNKTLIIDSMGKYDVDRYYQIVGFTEPTGFISINLGVPYSPVLEFAAVNVVLNKNYEEATFRILSKSSEVEFNEDSNSLQFTVEYGTIVNFELEGKNGYLTYTYTFADNRGEIIKICYTTKNVIYCIVKVDGILQNGIKGENEFIFNSGGGNDKLIDIIFGLKSYDTSLA